MSGTLVAIAPSNSDAAINTVQIQRDAVFHTREGALGNLSIVVILTFTLGLFQSCSHFYFHEINPYTFKNTYSKGEQVNLAHYAAPIVQRKADLLFIVHPSQQTLFTKKQLRLKLNTLIENIEGIQWRGFVSLTTDDTPFKDSMGGELVQIKSGIKSIDSSHPEAIDLLSQQIHDLSKCKTQCTKKIDSTRSAQVILEHYSNLQNFRTNADLHIIFVSKDGELTLEESTSEDNNIQSLTQKITSLNIANSVMIHSLAKEQQTPCVADLRTASSALPIKTLPTREPAKSCAPTPLEQAIAIGKKVLTRSHHLTLPCPADPKSIQITTYPKVKQLDYNFENSSLVFMPSLPETTRAHITYNCSQEALFTPLTSSSASF